MTETRVDASAAERLIVAADFDPRELVAGRSGKSFDCSQKLFSLVSTLRDLGVCIKVNSLLRFTGYQLLSQLKSIGVRSFADLKIIDIPATMALDAVFLAEYDPAIVTVMAWAGSAGIAAVKQELPNTKVLAVTVLTSLDYQALVEMDMVPALDIADEGETKQTQSENMVAVVRNLALMAERAGADGVIASPKEALAVRQCCGPDFLIATPGIRPADATVKKDDQARVDTPRAAIRNGADYLVVGRPITQAPDPRAAALAIINEMSEAFAERTAQDIV